MTNGQRTGYLGGFRLMSELVEAGCSVNGLTQSDYGFDFHVQLPVERATPEHKKWELSANSVLIQLKSGQDTHEYVEITDTHWETWMASPTPVYVAGVATDHDQLWIEPVDSLKRRDQPSAYGASMVPVLLAPDTTWDVDWFLHDAGARARIGSAPLRQWWKDERPKDPSGVVAWLGRLACGFHFFDGSDPIRFGEDVHATVDGWIVSMALTEVERQGSIGDITEWGYENGTNPAEHCHAFARQLAALGATFDDPVAHGVDSAIAWGLGSMRRYWE